MVELAKSDLEVAEEIAPEQIAPYWDGANGGVEAPAAEVGMKNFDPMNSTR